MRVHRLAFTVGGDEAAAGYQLQLPDDLFDHSPVELAGIAIKPIPPLAMYGTPAAVLGQQLGKGARRRAHSADF
jgi:hypothetical protein